MTEAALVLLSGGQDSATCLAWALARFKRVETVGFQYGQRHAVEMDVRDDVRRGVAGAVEGWADRLGPDRVVRLDALRDVDTSALTRDLPLDLRPDGLPASFVPGRNLLFLTFAAVVASQRGLRRVVTGVCETDYSGYPDCRDDTMKALQVAINLGMAERLVIDTPLMWIDKAGTWAMARDLGGDALVETIRTRSHTCYVGDRSVLRDWGYGCGQCDACTLRRSGWERWKAAGFPTGRAWCRELPASGAA